MSPQMAALIAAQREAHTPRAFAARRRIGVMRTSSEAGAEKIFNRGLMFASVGVKGHGKWGTNRKIAEFAYPRILMRFGDVLVAFQDFGPLSEGEKSSLIAEFENAVQEWRKRGAETKAFETPITELLAPLPAKLSQVPDTSSMARLGGISESELNHLGDAFSVDVNHMNYQEGGSVVCPGI